MTHTRNDISELLAAHGLSPRRAFGQNFVVDANTVRRIARLAGVGPGDFVLEIGAGLGSLTLALAETGATIVAIEIDNGVVEVLRSVVDHLPNVEVIHGDALAFDAAAHLESPIHIVANLPYNVGTELLVRWLTPAVWPPFWQSLTLMFQKEVAERIVARPGSSAYGRLALLVQWRADARIVLRLPPEAFTPAPKVHSAVVHITRRAGPLYPANPVTLGQITTAAFGQRRKMLRPSLRGLGPDIEKQLLAADIEPTARAEEIYLEKFCALARIVETGRGIS